ncbi:UDP-3-O-acyl-N-acetylglucosamine deacetylase [Gilvimarinus sp. SDUM040013]|uniref:UDP-3-O-acyl-N-acetylglucosamine deacetylase n=1 Tax=Gilvimarinus gilvus TaxID=3058038 RepID=A0ABU4S5G8_9GAMM|nr:UDP-3-O-acyl-N-acetylglucosamine deacetylase [Gilvimarinus sp. SDUM040013]MDO3385845.1 UDP-3-O-acyl-N-acetylglucosamine deacetylase [Gilvimarinus sp. SDUM040013]MDX6851138.1 UDP-3-O-acyl-N-acetylglucosamine deacetylase [Gilvimarinus sp. SDUM040013]
MTSSQYYQHTINTPFTCFGRGLHTGVPVVMKVLPAGDNTGRTFVRRDCLTGQNDVRAIWFNVRNTQLSTTLCNRFGVTVTTVEHLMAAFAAHGVDNVKIVLDGPEVPILEGSSRTFSDLILASGLKQQRARRKVIVVKRAVQFDLGDRSGMLVPGKGLTADLEIDFEAQAIGRQAIKGVELNEETFVRSIRDARTFGVVDDVEQLMQNGFARGASLKNALVVQGDRILNPEGLHYPDECVRHKVLDLYGDLAMAGAPIKGHFRGLKSGHHINANVVTQLLTDSQSFEFIDAEQADRQWQKLPTQVTA